MNECGCVFATKCIGDQKTISGTGLAFHLGWSRLFTISCSIYTRLVGPWASGDFCLRLPPQRRSTDVSDMCTTLSGFMWVQRLMLPSQALYPFRHYSRPWVEDYEWRPTSHLLSYYLKGRGRRIVTSLRTAWATKWYPDSKTTTKQSSNDKTKPKLGEKVIWYPWG